MALNHLLFLYRFSIGKASSRFFSPGFFIDCCYCLYVNYSNRSVSSSLARRCPVTEDCHRQVAAPHRTIPYRTAPHCTAPHRTAPHRSQTRDASDRKHATGNEGWTI
ncbi:hypothetical protein PoB_004456100 [Plakobranchus ocellatus]|uniref:Secreted protein n=1 Tax=Plakobranchus ocellatus TaxID=259542 RepID=A0AAV4B3Y9_9GAST|nr:hypothetical protein PoB_004456100 [Plakobranchus ocellatus]